MLSMIHQMYWALISASRVCIDVDPRGGEGADIVTEREPSRTAEVS